MNSNTFAATRMLRQARVFALARLGNAILVLSVQLLVVRWLAIDDYAAYVLFTAASSLLVLLSMLGLDRVTYRFVPLLKGKGAVHQIVTFFAVTIGVRLALLTLLLIGMGLYGSQFLPGKLIAQVLPYLELLMAFSVALAATDSLAIYCNSLGQQALQSVAALVAGVGRSLGVVGCALVLPEQFTLHILLKLFVLSESALALFLLAAIWRDLAGTAAAVRNASSEPVATIPVGEVCRDALSTQFSYLLRLPFQGNVLRLVVGSFASPAVTAAFGFFQTLADRLYLFLPLTLFKGVTEPALASDYDARKDIRRLTLVLSLLLRANLVLLALGVALLLGMGESLINLLTGGKYGTSLALAVLICGQLVALSLAEVLWIGLNPLGRLARLNGVWAWMSLLAAIGLGIAVWARSAEFLVMVSLLPYFALIAWMRWMANEPLLVAGFGLGRMLRLLLPLMVTAAALRAVAAMTAPDAWGIAALTSVGVTIFVVVMARAGIVTPWEIEQVSEVSPRLARSLRPLAGTTA